MERILIIGGNGCGKTTFAKALSIKLQLPLVHLDALYWRDHWQTTPNDEFDALLLREVTKPKWILDGNMTRTLPFRLNYCDTVIYMDFPRLPCLCGAIKRVIKNYGESRPDMGGYCPERFDFPFLRTVWNFNKSNRKRYYDLLSHADNVNVILLKNRKQVNAFLQKLSACPDAESCRTK